MKLAARVGLLGQWSEASDRRVTMDDHDEGPEPLRPDWGSPEGLVDLPAGVARTLGFEQSGEAMEGVGVWPSGDSSDSEGEEDG